MTNVQLTRKEFLKSIGVVGGIALVAPACGTAGVTAALDSSAYTTINDYLIGPSKALAGVRHKSKLKQMATAIAIKKDQNVADKEKAWNAISAFATKCNDLAKRLAPKFVLDDDVADIYKKSALGDYKLEDVLSKLNPDSEESSNIKNQLNVKSIGGISEDKVYDKIINYNEQKPLAVPQHLMIFFCKAVAAGATPKDHEFLSASLTGLANTFTNSTVINLKPITAFFNQINGNTTVRTCCEAYAATFPKRESTDSKMLAGKDAAKYLVKKMQVVAKQHMSTKPKN